MDMMDRIINSYNELARCQVGPLPENIKHPMITDEEAKEPCWMQITKTEWEALQPLLIARVSFRVQWNAESEDYTEYDRPVANACALTDDAGNAWMRVTDSPEWGDLLRSLILIIDSWGGPRERDAEERTEKWESS